MELNLLLLLFVALVPWPTGLIAEYLRHGGQSSAAAVAYGIVLGLMATCFTAIWIWLARKEDLAHPALKPRIGIAIRRLLVGAAAYTVGALAALLSAPAAFALYGAATLFFTISGRTAQVREQTA